MLADIVVYSTLVVVWDYVASAAKATSWATWSGHPMRFIVLALGLAFVFAGCAGVAAARIWPESADKLDWTPVLLCAGVMLYVLANKRSCLASHQHSNVKAHEK